MSFVEYAVTAPAGDWETVAVRLSHSAWPNSRYYVDAKSALDAEDENGDEVTFYPTGVEADGEPTDDTGIDSRGIAVPDPENVLWRLIEGLSQAGNPNPIEATFFRYGSDSVTPLAYAVLTLTAPSRDGRVVSFEASNANTINRDAPPRRFTYSGNPGLRR